ncbi:MAG TPA: DUF29 domain-containing protein [Xanthobacteraceae bacterium]
MGRRETIAAATAPKKPADRCLYDADYYAWVQAQVSALERKEIAALDLAHLADEVADLGRAQKRAVRSNLGVLLPHLIKWTYQPDRRKGGWESSIREHRDRLREELADSPSLRGYAEQLLEDQYRRARLRAGDQMRKSVKSVPQSCPFTMREVLDPHFLPK